MKESPEQGFATALREGLTVEHVTALEACLDCRQCGSACAWYLGTGDAALHPKHKTDFLRAYYRRHLSLTGKLASGLGLGNAPDETDLREALPSFWHCTTCGRCTLACPLGLSNRGLVRLARSAFTRSGLIAETPALRQVYEGSRDLRHSFALSSARVHLRMGLLAHHAGLTVPFDLPDADYLYVGSAVANTRFPDFDLAIPALLNASGVAYTYSSRVTDTGTDIEHVVVDRAISRAMLAEVEAEALRLGARTMIVSECGCDVRTFYVEAAEILGRPLRVRMQSIDSLLLELIETGRLPVQPVVGRVTLHDPCKLTRLSGLGDLVRELLARVAEEVVEMSPNRELNYCCNGGTGPLRMPETAEVRRHISRIKAEQIRATRAERVISPCAVCMLTLEDVCRTYGLATRDGRGSYLLTELVHEAVRAALRARGEEQRMRVPGPLRGRDHEDAAAPTLAARVRRLAHAPGFAADLAWLQTDAVWERYTRKHPDAHDRCAAWAARLVAEAGGA